MKIEPHPFCTVNWTQVNTEEHSGIYGKALWKVIHMGDIRIRMVEYTPGYSANHWCSKGHIIYCIEGEMETELEDGRTYTLNQGMSYHTGDNSEAHRTSTKGGCKLFIVD